MSKRFITASLLIILISACTRQIATPEYVNGIVIAGTSLVVSATFDIKNTLEKTKTKGYTRKYLTDLTKLQPD